jgi:aminopeptidase N
MKLFKPLALLCLSSICCLYVHAQERDLHYHRNVNPVTATSYAAASRQGDNIDVIYQRCTWRIHPDSPSSVSPLKYLRGNVTTVFKTITTGVNQISFDFNNVHTIDAVLYKNQRLPSASVVWLSSKILQLTLPAPIASAGSIDSVSIQYRGIPPSASGQAIGYQRGGSSSNNYIYTLSESYEDRDWWPCKHDMTDKIDSMDIIVSVPNGFWVAANGKLVDSSLVGSNRVFRFQHRHPIPTYLVSLGVARYVRFHRTPVTLGNKQVPIVYNLFPGRSNNSYNNIISKLDQCRTEMVEFSKKYGDYPFADEKYGHYEFGWGGGMEHQTFSAMGGSALTSWSTIAHELAHQWFGNKVTFATWNDLWIAEGFARFNETLAAELVPGLATPTSYRGAVKSAARSVATTPVYINNATSSNSIWTSANSVAVYDRACMVISMLRTMMGDTKFFQACRNFLNDPQLAYKSAGTADVQRHFQAVFGSDLTAFFNAWIYGYGNPSYNVSWYSSGNKIILRLQQNRSTGASATYFPMPVVLTVRNATGSASKKLVIYDRGSSCAELNDGVASPSFVAGSFSYVLPFTPASVSFDPDNQTMATGTVAQTFTSLEEPLLLEEPPADALRKQQVKQSGTGIYPNPASSELRVVRKNATQAVLRVIDANGNTVLEQSSNSLFTVLNVKALPSGAYTLQIREHHKTAEGLQFVIQR